MKYVYWAVEGVLAGRPGPSCVPWNLKHLRQGGIDAIVSLDDAVDPQDIKAAGILHLPAYRQMVLLETPEDHRQFLSVMPSILRFLDACEKMGRAALVHCHYGCDRTGAVLACYLLARHKMTPKQAFDHIRYVNPRAFGALGYAEAILTFNDMLREDPLWIPSNTP